MSILQIIWRGTCTPFGTVVRLRHGSALLRSMGAVGRIIFAVESHLLRAQFRLDSRQHRKPRSGQPLPSRKMFTAETRENVCTHTEFLGRYSRPSLRQEKPWRSAGENLIPDSFIFPSSRRTAINTNNFRFRMLREAGRKAGIKGVTHQMLRRTCSTYMSQLTTVKDVQAHLRHS